MPNDQNQIPKVVAGVFSLAFLGIGLTIIISLWSAPFGAFHSPPLVFRVFGSFMALPFVAIGGAGLYGIITGRGARSSLESLSHRLRRTGRKQAEYVCPNCGAPIADGGDVSPSGDAKCRFCKTWFSVH